jgi:hypothetical protein
MPLYLFEHPETRETVEVVQKMNDPHVYVDEDGTEWSRVWVAPNAAMDSNVDPFSESDFVRKTASMKGTVGDIWDYSKELGERRKDKEGKDKLKEAHDKKRAKTLGKRRREFMTKQAKAEVVRREKQSKKKKKS